jgi:hypothetical protein
MKHILILASISLIALFNRLNAQTHPVIWSQNGVLYWVTGSNGVVFNSDGTIDFVGTMTMTQLTPAEILALGVASPNPNDPISIRVPCGADQITYGNPPTTVHPTENKCGPMTLTQLPGGGTKATCHNTNSWLCYAKIPSATTSAEYLNSDCN